MQSKKEQALDILMLEPGATQKQVKSAFRREALRTHPDKGGVQKDFELVKQAYDYLVKHGLEISTTTGPPTGYKTWPPHHPMCRWRVYYATSATSGFTVIRTA